MRLHTLHVVVSVVALGAIAADRALAQDHACHGPESRLIGCWCDKCGAGYVGFVRVPSRALFEAIDAHGHEIRIETFDCSACREAYAADGYCATCRIGFVKKEAYFSRLTYLLAKGDFSRATNESCPTCRKSGEPAAWCETCKVGRLGRLFYGDKETFAQAARAVDVLKKAIELLPQCESCAVAMAVDRKCRRCGISYLQGKATKE